MAGLGLSQGLPSNRKNRAIHGKRLRSRRRDPSCYDWQPKMAEETLAESGSARVMLKRVTLFKYVTMRSASPECLVPVMSCHSYLCHPSSLSSTLVLILFFPAASVRCRMCALRKKRRRTSEGTTMIEPRTRIRYLQTSHVILEFIH